jgi:hypothetical protein
MPIRLTFALVVFLPLPGQTATLHVSKAGDASDGLSWPSAYTAIGDALATSASGDEIWVASGTYNEAIEMVTGVALYGGFEEGETEDSFDSRNPSHYLTVIDATSLDTHVVVGADHALLNGFTVTHGDANQGGGVYCYRASPKIENCVIANNQAGGFFDGHGGGIYCFMSSATFENCVIEKNSAFSNFNSHGGGVYSTSSTLTMRSCIVSNNTVTGGSFPERDAMGGGLSLVSTSATLSDCSIDSNLVTGGHQMRGGGIYAIEGCDLELVNSAISRNTVSPGFDRQEGYAGGMYILGSHANLTNCTIADNSAVPFDGIIVGTSQIGIANCIFSEFSRQIATDNISAVSVSYSCILEGREGVGNIDADPLFVDPENGDFRLRYGSLCIDSGTIVETLTDLDGNARPVDIPGVGIDGPGAFDMGAYEYQFPKSDLNRNGYVEAMDLFMMGSDWMKATDASRR